MADRANQVKGNVPGRYFVDDQCIHCGVCVDLAPDNFMFDDDDRYAYVYRQPANDKEEAACVASEKSCPVSAIGHN